MRSSGGGVPEDDSYFTKLNKEMYDVLQHIKNPGLRSHAPEKLDAWGAFFGLARCFGTNR
jgi:hypothetical protein